MVRGVLLAFILVSASCHVERSIRDLSELTEKANPSKLKIVIVGIDGATLDIVKPMREKGLLPSFTKLIERGAHGKLESVEPTISPSIWTSIVTGKSADEHGITDFVLGWGPRSWKHLVTSNDRRVAALWNMASAFGVTTGFVGWWASWPAEEVNGWVVSDRMTQSRYSLWEDGLEDRHLTFPEGLARDIEGLVVDPKKLRYSDMEYLVSLNQEEIQEFEASEKPIMGHGLSVVKFAFASQRTYEEIALQQLAAEQPELTGVFLIANDPISHTFWHYYQPEDFEGVDREDAERLGALVPNFYEHNDRYLAKLLEVVDEDTVVFIVSDHGFISSGILPKQLPRKKFSELKKDARAKGTIAVGQSGKHHIDGIFIAAGYPILEGVEVNASIYDIAPTILALLGLPVAEDMIGNVLTEIIEPEFLEKYPIRVVDSYENYLLRPTIKVEESGADEALKEQLKSLGYIE